MEVTICCRNQKEFDEFTGFLPIVTPNWKYILQNRRMAIARENTFFLNNNLTTKKLATTKWNNVWKRQTTKKTTTKPPKTTKPTTQNIKRQQKAKTRPWKTVWTRDKQKNKQKGGKRVGLITSSEEYVIDWNTSSTEKIEEKLNFAELNIMTLRMHSNESTTTPAAIGHKTAILDAKSKESTDISVWRFEVLDVKKSEETEIRGDIMKDLKHINENLLSSHSVPDDTSFDKVQSPSTKRTKTTSVNTMKKYFKKRKSDLKVRKDVERLIDLTNKIVTLVDMKSNELSDKGINVTVEKALRRQQYARRHPKMSQLSRRLGAPIIRQNTVNENKTKTTTKMSIDTFIVESTMSADKQAVWNSIIELGHKGDPDIYDDNQDFLDPTNPRRSGQGDARVDAKDSIERRMKVKQAVFS